MRGRTVSIASLPAPVGGWNAKDPVAQMGPKDAVILDNFFPRTTEVALREGAVAHATGLPGTVETLMPYNAPTGVSSMFAAAQTAFYDVTNVGAVGAPVQTGLSNAQWRSTNFATPGGAFLYAVNGLDEARLWNGSVWQAMNAGSTPAFTGVSTNLLTHVNVYARRLWFVETNSMRVWYLPTDSVGGAALSVNFASLFTKGGYLMAMGTWTLDSGSGMDDHAVFFTSRGQAAVYQGIDPSTPSGFVLVGVYDIGEPVNRNCFVKYGSDLLLICRDGVQPLSAALQSSRVSTKVSITDKIQQAMGEAVGAYASRYGWSLLTYAEKDALILNVPSTGGSQQYVMNTISGAWCRFVGWDASCFAQIGSRLFFGTAGVVAEAWIGPADFGQAITGRALPSFQYHGGTTQKRYTMARVITTVDSPSVGVLLGLNLDFAIVEPTGSLTFTPSPVAVWDTDLWDVGAWSDGLTTRKEWGSVGGVGYCAAVYLLVRTNLARLRWQAIDYVYERGVGVT